MSTISPLIRAKIHHNFLGIIFPYRELKSEMCPQQTTSLWVAISTLNNVLNMNFRSRDRDCAVERSPGLEFLNQLFSGGIADAAELELKAYGIEERDIRAHRLGAVHESANLHGNALHRNVR